MPGCAVKGTGKAGLRLAYNDDNNNNTDNETAHT
jgi:hypothetical protein